MDGDTVRLPEALSAAVVERVRAALKAQGFGVLTEIDVCAIVHDKLGQDISART